MHRYPPAVWNEEDEEDEDVEWDDEGYEDEDPDLAEEQERERELAQGGPLVGMEPDDGKIGKSTRLNSSHSGESRMPSSA